MAGAIYRAEFVVTEQPISQEPHKKASIHLKKIYHLILLVMVKH